MQVDFLLMRSYGRKNALTRVQSDPLMEGLQELNQSVHRCIITPGQNIDIPKPRHLIVSVDDRESIKIATHAKKATGCKVICLGADIYSLEYYVQLSELVDLFIMPTQLHQEILASAVWVDVRLVPESVDAIALTPDGVTLRPQGNDLCWFGYPESFSKSMAYILERAIKTSGLSRSRFATISAPDFTSMAGVRNIPFDEKTFYSTSKAFGYSVLSHFAFDCHLNSFIKSPNKLITSIVRGLIPLASCTPSYRELMREYNLEKLLYSSGNELVSLLRNLNAERDVTNFKLDLVAQDLAARFSPARIARIFLDQLG